MGKSEESEVICVDLDYTLISTDILIEQIIKFLKRNPFKIFLLVIWFFKSKRYLKKKLFENVKVDYLNLPYREEVINFIKQEKERNKKVVLITATYYEIANQINSQLKIFDEVYGSNENISLKGKNKEKFLVGKFGIGAFSYIGDSISDLPIWRKSRKSYLVSNSRFMNFLLKKRKNFAGNLLPNETKLVDFFKLLRLHQWVKNILIFIPLLLAHEFQNFFAISRSIIAFFSFSLLASALYIMNDIIDIDNDRNHPTKKFRPIASGYFSAYTALFISFITFTSALILGWQVNYTFILILLAYVLINLFYSLWAKQVEILDIFTLSIFYVIRLYAGSVATNIQISNWLLAFSMFFFLSLATLKRFSEIKLSNSSPRESFGRPYSPESSNFFLTFGIASSFASIVVLILYINSEKVLGLYRNPNFLWLDAFLLLLWMSIIWNLANKGKIDYDPVFESLKNPTLVLLELGMIVVWFMALLL